MVGNTFRHDGHHILGVYASYNVVRGNTFHNEEWYPCHRDGGLCGNRNVILNSSDPTENVGNVIAFSGLPPDNDSSTGLSIRTRSNIVRRNLFFHCDSSGAPPLTRAHSSTSPSSSSLFRSF